MIDKYNEVGIEIEADGFITPLEQMSMSKAKPATECIYPRCEKCDKYHGSYCTVPIVFSKQYSLILDDEIELLGKRIDELENLVTEAIFGSSVKSYTLSDNPIENPKEINLTWADVLGEDE